MLVNSSVGVHTERVWILVIAEERNTWVKAISNAVTKAIATSLSAERMQSQPPVPSVNSAASHVSSATSPESATADSTMPSPNEMIVATGPTVDPAWKEEILQAVSSLSARMDTVLAASSSVPAPAPAAPAAPAASAVEPAEVAPANDTSPERRTLAASVVRSAVGNALGIEEVAALQGALTEQTAQLQRLEAQITALAANQAQQQPLSVATSAPVPSPAQATATPPPPNASAGSTADAAVTAAAHAEYETRTRALLVEWSRAASTWGRLEGSFSASQAQWREIESRVASLAAGEDFALSSSPETALSTSAAAASAALASWAAKEGIVLREGWLTQARPVDDTSMAEKRFFVLTSGGFTAGLRYYDSQPPATRVLKGTMLLSKLAGWVAQAEPPMLEMAYQSVPEAQSSTKIQLLAESVQDAQEWATALDEAVATARAEAAAAQAAKDAQVKSEAERAEQAATRTRQLEEDAFARARGMMLAASGSVGWGAGPVTVAQQQQLQQQAATSPEPEPCAETAVEQAAKRKANADAAAEAAERVKVEEAAAAQAAADAAEAADLKAEQEQQEVDAARTKAQREAEEAATANAKISAEEAVAEADAAAAQAQIEKLQAEALDARLEAEATARATAEKEVLAKEEARELVILQAERDERAAKNAMGELAAQKEASARLQAQLEQERDEAFNALKREREANASAAAATESLRLAAMEQRSAAQMQVCLFCHRVFFFLARADSHH